jgi:hypothetical protein
VVEKHTDGHNTVCAWPKGRWLAQTEGPRYVLPKRELKEVAAIKGR